MTRSLFDRRSASASTVRVSFWIFTIENGIAVLKSVESRPNGLPVQETNTDQGNRREESCFNAVVVHSCRVGASIMITRSRLSLSRAAQRNLYMYVRACSTRSQLIQTCIAISRDHCVIMLLSTAAAPRAPSCFQLGWTGGLNHLSTHTYS